MDEQRIEQELRSFFTEEVKEVEPPLQWWNNAIFRVGENKLSFWEKFTSGFGQSVWRTVTATTLVIVIAIGMLYGTGVLPGFQSDDVPVPAPMTTVPSVTVPAVITTPATTTPPPRSLRVTAATDKLSYLPGEQVKLEFSIINITQEPLTLSHFTYAEITRLGIMVRSFDSGSQEVKLAPGESTTFNLTWDQLDSGGKPVKPAVYQLAVEYITITKGVPPITTQQSYHAIGQVQIIFPQGAMQKTIEVNQSQTVSGITMTLERVELSATEIKLYFLKTPGYSPQQPGILEPPSRQGIAEMECNYRIDNGNMIGPVSFGYLALKNGVEYVWKDLYPVPNDAQKLFFYSTKMSIPRVGSFGLFEYVVPLQ